jgi:DeoR family fructose operon transcriptional repressor
VKAAERQLRIRQMFESKDFLDLETLCLDLDASESSIRRDLDDLEEEGVLKRVYGGAVPAQPTANGAFDFTVEADASATKKTVSPG